MLQWDDDLRVAGTPLYLDSRRPRPVCFVSHAHSDHIPYDGAHESAYATAATAELAEYRTGMTTVTRLGYRTLHALDADTRLRLLPAGHVLGSAMLRVERPEGALLYTGDFKLRPSLTVEQADPEPADVLVMESTYGLPMFRFPTRGRRTPGWSRPRPPRWPPAASRSSWVTRWARPRRSSAS